VPDASQTDAFVALVTGLSARNHLYEEALHLIGGDLVVQAGRGGLLPFDAGFPLEALDASLARIESSLASRDNRVELVADVVIRPFALPHTGYGRMRSVLRAEFQSGDGGRVYLSSELESLLGALDGTRSGRDLLESVAPERRDEARSALINMAGMGAIRFRTGSAEASTAG
jgi:hypothetical protein